MSPRSFRTTLALLALAHFPFATLSLRSSEVSTEGAELGRWTMDFEAASKLAKEKDLPLFLHFTGSDWCGWCIMMDKAVFAKKEWTDYAAKSVVLVTLDFPKDESVVPSALKPQNDRLAKQYKVEGYPSYVIVDSDGTKELGRLGAGEGKTPETFIEEVEAVLRFRPASIEKKVAELGEEKGAAYRAALGEVTKAKEGLEAWLSTEPQRNPENDAKFEAFQKQIKEASAAVEAF